MSSDRAPVGPPSTSRHHFRPSDPADVVDAPVPIEGAPVQGPLPPRPWYRLVAGQWPLFVTLVVVASGVALAGTSHWKRGAAVAGAGLLLAALLRLVLPEKAAGLLCCRSRWIDVAATALVGAGIIALALVISPTRT